MISLAGWTALAAALAALAAVTVSDARRFIVPLPALAVFAAAGTAWRVIEAPSAAQTAAFWWPALLGGLIGLAVILVPIAAAELLGRRWPVYPGDAWLLGAVGFVVGPLGLAWTLSAGSALALLHRACIQRRRGRPFRRGLTPLGPGLALAAAGVLVAACSPPAAPPSPMPSTAVAPPAQLLPPELADREVRLDQPTPVPWPLLARRASALGGFGSLIEERPARVAGGAAKLAPVPAMAMSYTGDFRGLLDRLAYRSGYAWDATGPSLTWYRHWDVEWPPRADAVTEAVWVVDADRHGTVEAVLAEWAATAGWTLVWKPRSEWTVSADATFRGTFVEAVDRLLSEGPVRSAVVPVAYGANRHLVIESAEGLR